MLCTALGHAFALSIPLLVVAKTLCGKSCCDSGTCYDSDGKDGPDSCCTGEWQALARVTPCFPCPAQPWQRTETRTLPMCLAGTVFPATGTQICCPKDTVGYWNDKTPACCPKGEQLVLMFEQGSVDNCC